MSLENFGNLKLGRYQDVLADEVDEFLELAKTVQNDLSFQSVQYPEPTDWSSVVPPIWDADLLKSYVQNIVSSQFHSELQPSDSSVHGEETTLGHKIEPHIDVESKDAEFVSWKLVTNSKDTQTEGDNLLNTVRKFDKSKPSELNKVRSELPKELTNKLTNSKPATKQIKSTPLKRYKCLRFVGSLQPEKINFASDHPKLVLKEPQSKVLFPRRCAKQKTLKLSINEPSAGTQEQRKNPTDRDDNTWHEALIFAKNIIKSQKVLRYTSKSTSPICSPKRIQTSSEVECSEQTKDKIGKDIIYDPTTIESTSFAPDLVKYKIQNLPILCIRGECKVQRAVNISVADKVEADDKLVEDDKTNVRYYEYVHNSCPNGNSCELEDNNIGDIEEGLPEVIIESPGARNVNRFIAPFQQQTYMTEEEYPETEREYESSGETSSAQSTIQQSENSSQTDEEKLRMKRNKWQKENFNSSSFVAQPSLSDSSFLAANDKSTSDNSILNILREVLLQSDNEELNKTESLPEPKPNLSCAASDRNNLPYCKNISIQTDIEKNSVAKTKSFQNQKSITRDIFNKILKDKPKRHTKFNSHCSTANTFKPLQLRNNSIFHEKVDLKHMQCNSSSALSNHITVTNSPNIHSKSSPSIGNIDRRFETSQQYSEQNEIRNSKKNEMDKSSTSTNYKCDHRSTASNYKKNKLENFSGYDVDGRNAKYENVESLLCRTPTQILKKTLTERDDSAVRRATRSFLQSLQDSEFEQRSSHRTDEYDVAYAFDVTNNRKEPELEGSASSKTFTNFENFLENNEINKYCPSENLTDDEFLKFDSNKSLVKFLNVSKELTASTNSIEFHISKLKVLDDGIDIKSSLSSSSSNSSVKMIRSVNMEPIGSTTDGEVLSLGEVKTLSDESGF